MEEINTYRKKEINPIITRRATLKHKTLVVLDCLLFYRAKIAII
jgi:hypothetical protein